MLKPAIGSFLRTAFASFLAIAPGVLRAQTSPMYVGGGLAIGFNLHDLNVPVYRGDTLCGVFTSGTSILPSGFLTFETPLGDPAHSLWIAPRLHFSDLGALITTPATDTGRLRDVSTPDSHLVATHRAYHLDASILALGADLFFKYPLTSRLFLFGGPSLNYLIRRDATLAEVVTDPPHAVFFNGSQTRSVSSGQIVSSASLLATVTLGGSLDIPLSPKVMLAPELNVTVPINSIRSDYRWRITTVSLGVALKFNVAPEKKIELVQPPPPPPKPQSAIAATVKIFGVLRDSTGAEQETPEPQIRVEEFLRREAYPTLNYIFFPEGKAALDLTRLHLLGNDSLANGFDPSSLSGKSNIDVYREALNILGKRLREKPQATIVLTGTNANSGTETNALDLSRTRTDGVKKYLVNIWKIDSNRITTLSENLPKNASPSDSKEGADENRRVEISSPDPTLLDPLTVETIDRTMNPPMIRVRTTESSALPIEYSTLDLHQGSRETVRLNASLPEQLWIPKPDELPRTDSSLIAIYRLRDSLGTEFTATDSAHVEQLTVHKKREERVKDKIIEHYNLITFNFDKADLEDRARRVIADIAKSVTPNDKIVIRGYTDMMGERAHNLELSQARAKAVESALRETLGDRAASVTFETQGEGEGNIVDNRLPEGRFLSRTVFVELQKPIQ